MDSTRPEKEIHISYASSRYKWGSLIFCEPSRFIEDIKEDTGLRAVWALYKPSVTAKNRELTRRKKGNNKPETLEIFSPMSNENPRLVTQGGLFTRIDGITIEDWVRKNFKGIDDSYILFKITIPSKDRRLCLRSLNRMNINHLSLFPDLYGASIFCNTDLMIDKY